MRTIETPACLPKTARAVVTGPKEDPTIVVTTGKGDQGIVFVPEHGRNFCQWVDQMTRYDKAGYRVASLAWSADGKASVAAAVDVLRVEGAVGVVLVGSSKGGAYVADMADELATAPLGVIALSPPATFEKADATSAHSKYAGPLLVVASAGDGNVPVTDSKLVARAADPSTYLEMAGGAHGVAIFQTDSGAQLQSTMDTFMTTAFSPR